MIEFALYTLLVAQPRMEPQNETARYPIEEACLEDARRLNERHAAELGGEVKYVFKCGAVETAEKTGEST